MNPSTLLRAGILLLLMAAAPARAAMFSESRLNEQGTLYLTPTPEYRAAEETKQAVAVRLALAEQGAKTTLAVVVLPGGGELWQRTGGRAVLLDSWSDFQAPGRRQPKAGRWFGFLGGQMVSGGPAEGSGFNGRFGSTLLEGKYDLAATLTYNSVTTSPASNTRSYGLVGRALFPLNKQAGYNLGAQVLRSDPSRGDPFNAISVLGGVSFYLPGGSFDITANIGNHGLVSLIAGYTFYINK